MQFQWGIASNDGGMTLVEGPKLDTFPKGNVQKKVKKLTLVSFFLLLFFTHLPLRRNDEFS